MGGVCGRHRTKLILVCRLSLPAGASVLTLLQALGRKNRMCAPTAADKYRFAQAAAATYRDEADHIWMVMERKTRWYPSHIEERLRAHTQQHALRFVKVTNSMYHSRYRSYCLETLNSTVSSCHPIYRRTNSSHRYA